MMADRKRLIHYFTGFGGAVAMVLRRDNDTVLTDDQQRFLPTVAPASLASIGGISRAQQTGVSFHDLLTVGAAETVVSGDFQPARSAARFTRGNWSDNQLPAVTIVAGTVSNAAIVNGGRKVEFDHVSFKLVGSTKVDNNDIPGITVEAALDGFRIDGAPLRVKFAPREFMNVPDLAAFRARAVASPAFLERFGTFLIPANSLVASGKPPKRLPPARHLLFTVVDSIRWESNDHPQDVTIEGRNRIVIPGWGRLILGELRMRNGMKQISMIRGELGSPFGGELEIAFGGENGSGWPP